MIDLPQEIIKLYNTSKNDFENLLVTIQEEYEKLKIDFLAKVFYVLKSKPKIND
jgi:hypothetical protein